MRRFSGRRITRRAVAVAAAGIVIAAGATATSLAAWTDTEWVFGSATGNARLGTSVFGVQQSVVGDSTAFTDRSTADGGSMVFTVNAASLSPGADVFGYVNLRTIVKSVGATVVLNPATQGATTDADLFAALVYSARVVGASVTCDASVFSAATSASIQEIVPTTTALTVGSGSSTFALDAGTTTDPGTAKRVCFRVTLPAGASSSLQGKGAYPVWNFVSTSS
ncbi:hypothetical protein [Naasia lichenicola]|uniref:Acyl-CoA dehydrogenase n=1 Tax=Naasia lichenicola TaxID=2565933 RepID=A0A4S4FQ35_9MICO|nr:hypothetical protein [Naasia lichenicola]THG32391.1 hypothetical protein E6C64_05080 [Naasia lichenicola]